MPKFREWHYAAEGITRRIFEPGKGIMSMEISFKPGSIGPAHAHPHEQVTFVISGRLEITVDGTPVVVGAGEQLIVPGNAVHSVLALEETAVLEVFAPLRADLLATITEA